MPHDDLINLQCRVVGTTTMDPAHVRVHVEWYDADDPERALRPDLIAEAEELEARAKALRADARVVPDQFDSLTHPHPNGRAAHATPDDVVGSFMRDKRDALARNLGLDVTPIDPPAPETLTAAAPLPEQKDGE